MPLRNDRFIQVTLFILSFTTATLLLTALPTRSHAAETPASLAVEQVVQETGIDRGVCCMLGFDADVALQLVQSNKFLVHILDADAETVAKVRRIAERAGVGIDRVVVQQREPGRLPYADNMIDLLVATKITDVALGDLAASEVLRVVRPEGAIVVGRDVGTDAAKDVATRLKGWASTEAAKTLGGTAASFVFFRKPIPAGVDQWPLWEHGPDNNPVSSDQIIQAPYMTQFMAEPYYITMPSITTVAGGRTFLATGHIAHHRREWDMVNLLIARNGYNGIELWRRKLPDGFLAHRSAFVATKDIFYLMDGDGCLMLDAATGAEQGRISIPDVAGDWKWMVLDKGVLYVMTGPKGDGAKVIKGDRSFGGWSWADLSRGYYVQPRVPWGFGNTIAAYDVAQKKLLWKHEEASPIDSRGMAMLDDKIFLYAPEKHLSCLRRSTGDVYWTNSDEKVLNLIEQPGRGLVSTPGFRSEPLSVATPDALVIQGQTRMNVIAVSTNDGSLLWTKKKFTNNPNAIYVDGKIVLGVGTRGAHAVVDPVSGDVLEELNFRKQACTRLTASPDSFFVRGEGTLRFDRKTKKVLIDGSARPGCNDGAIPANGLLYLGPWQCDCNLSLIGALAECSAGDFQFDAVDNPKLRLRRGEGDIQAVTPLLVTEGGWPMYRANNARSASTPTRLATPQTAAPGGRGGRWIYEADKPYVPTPPIAAGGIVFVAGSDGMVRAIDAQNGRLRWQYGTAGSIKASPTLWEGRLFVGSGDGNVYALEADSGRLLWRFRAAPRNRLMMVYGNLCSTWPVNTGVLVHEGTAYFAAGIVDHDGTYVYALDAKSGEMRWQNNTCGHLNSELRKGVSAQGNLSILGDRLLMAGGNQVSPAAFDLKTGECLNATFAQGQPKANHGKFVGVFADRYPVSGGRVLYASPRNVANKDSFVLYREGRRLTMSFGGVPPAWNENALALADYRNGKLQCFDVAKTAARIKEGFTPPSDRARPSRWSSLAQAFASDGAARWGTDLGNANQFEVLAVAATPEQIVAIVQFQNRVRAHPQWQLVALNATNGTPIWFWRHNLPVEPLPEGLAITSQGHVIVTSLDGRIVSLGPKQPAGRNR